MLQDVITATGSCDCGNYAHSVHQCLAYFCMHCLSIPADNSHYDDSEINFAGTLTAQPARNHPTMPKRAAGPAVVQALGFKCIICDGEFASKHAADCHRRQPAFIGTQCADPRSIRSLYLTERPDVSVGILRHQSCAPLGQSIYILYQPFTPFTSYISHDKHKLVHIFQ